MIFDDDPHYHTLLTHKLKPLQRKKRGIHVYTCSNEEQFSEYVDLPKDTTFFLIDYEIHGASYNGLEIILTKQLMPHACLVTNRDQDVALQQQCAAQGVKILPKSLIESVKFELVS